MTERRSGEHVADHPAPAPTTAPATAAPAGGHALLRMQAAAGNAATLAALGSPQFRLEVGAADDPYEREADAVARQVLSNLRAGSGPAAGGDHDAARRATPLRRVLRRTEGSAANAIGAEGGTVDADAEARLRSARSGGTPIDEVQRESLESAFGGADFSDVRLHEGPASADLNERFGAKAFTVGSDIFFRGPAPDLSSTSGTELLAHELTHTVQQGGSARRQVIRRDFVGTWDEVLPKLTPDAKRGYDQFVTLFGDSAADRIKQGCVARGGTNDGQFDTDKASSIWSKKAMSDEDFDKALAKKQAKDVTDVKTTLATMNHLCNETDGTHRPGSVGDGTSEWALKWEAENGEPFRSPAGHAYKLRDYCKVLSEGLATVASKKGSVGSTETMTWKENKNASDAEVNVLTQLALVVARATDRLTKMREGVVIWNDRISRYPDKWNDDGTSKVAPPGVAPLANNQLKAGWPKDKTVAVY